MIDLSDIHVNAQFKMRTPTSKMEDYSCIRVGWGWGWTPIVYDTYTATQEKLLLCKKTTVYATHKGVHVVEEITNPGTLQFLIRRNGYSHLEFFVMYQ